MFFSAAFFLQPSVMTDSGWLGLGCSGCRSFRDISGFGDRFDFVCDHFGVFGDRLPVSDSDGHPMPGRLPERVSQDLIRQAMFDLN